MPTFVSNPPDPVYTVLQKAGVLGADPANQPNQITPCAGYTSTFGRLALISTIAIPMGAIGGVMQDVTVATNMAFTVSSNASSGASCMLRVNAHTSYTVDFSAITRIGSGTYNSTGVSAPNIVQFYNVNGTNYYSVAGTS